MAVSTVKNPHPISEASISTSSFKGLSGKIHKWGNVCMMVLYGGSTNAALAANATLGTLPEGYRPKEQVQVLNTYTAAQERWMIAADGKIYPTVAVASGTSVRFSATYICA